MKKTYINAILGQITLGADPEILFTKDGIPWGGATSGICGTKSSPSAVNRGAIQVDGMALEYNTDPAEDVEDWIANHAAVQAVIMHRARAANLDMSYESLLHYDQYIDTQNPTEEETIFGCDPDYNADTLAENEMPDNDGSIKFRTAGGHVHIGMANWGALHGGDGEIMMQMAQQIVYVCDLVLGVWSVLHDNGVERKKLYGKAGAFRIKPYGVEYRTLSNFWALDQKMLAEVFNRTMWAMEDADRFAKLFKYATDNRVGIVRCINTNDIDAAQVYMNNLEAAANA